MGSFIDVPIVDGDDVESLYYMKAYSSHMPCEIYVEVEELLCLNLDKLRKTSQQT